MHYKFVSTQVNENQVVANDTGTYHRHNINPNIRVPYARFDPVVA